MCLIFFLMVKWNRQLNSSLIVTNLVMAYFITKFKKSPQDSNLSGMMGVAFLKIQFKVTFIGIVYHARTTRPLIFAGFQFCIR